MIRKIIKIDEEKCNGCGLCAKACHEGAIGMVNGKAKLLRDDYCDGLGDCLPVCPVDAISFEEREAAAYDEAAVKENMAKRAAGEHGQSHGGGCMSAAFNGTIRKDPEQKATPCSFRGAVHDAPGAVAVETSHPASAAADIPSALTHWPVQIKLAPVNAPYFDGADLLIAADCTAYAYGGFHHKFMKDKITLIGCPKLDMVDYTEKLTEILRQNDIRSVTVTRMVVPCCGGIQFAVQQAVEGSGKDIPLEIVTIGIDGSLL